MDSYPPRLLSLVIVVPIGIALIVFARKRLSDPTSGMSAWFVRPGAGLRAYGRFTAGVMLFVGCTFVSIGACAAISEKWAGLGILFAIPLALCMKPKPLASETANVMGSFAPVALPPAPWEQTTMQTASVPTVPATAPEKGLLTKRAKWTIVGVIAFIPFVFTLTDALLVNSGACKQAINAAEGNSVARESLGTPFKVGVWGVGGSIAFDAANGRADLSLPVHGPKGSGTLYVYALKHEGTWSMKRLTLRVKGRPELIVIVDGPPPPSE